MVVCPSWPQACIFPGMHDLWSKPFSSGMSSASRSARRPMTRAPSPTLRVPTTPVLARPRCTAMLKDSSLRATKSAVRTSSKAVSGCAWRSRRQSVSSAWIAWSSGLRLIGIAPSALQYRRASGSPDERQSFSFGERPDPQLLGLAGLRAGIRAHDDEVGFLRDRPRDLRAERFGARLRLAARHFLKRAGEHDRLAGDRKSVG